ncbi:conserved Plasmodium protein, unknown function [Plasmodium ovale curtisi]|uniref:Uncharacterized protein n=1 Tax=Plasmodium ovale curtisi TaxID=864141 RepID=A0A1A8VR14_PLAOA|nr:conserved Plasmodium protein, unknown function [Plasmodium ovale curtisi]
MNFNKYRKKFRNTKRRYCDEPEISKKGTTNFLSSIVASEWLKNLVLRNYFKTILDSVYENFQKNNFFFDVLIYMDLIKLIDSVNLAGCYVTQNFTEFTSYFNAAAYSLLSQFLQSFRVMTQFSMLVRDNLIHYLDIVLNNKFLIVILIPINTPIKTDCVLNLSKCHIMEKKFYNVIELINAKLLFKDKKSFLYKTFYMRICECSHKYLSHQNIIVKTNKIGDIDNKREDKKTCKICFTREYEEINSKRKFQNFFFLTFSFAKTTDAYNSTDEYTTIDVLYQDVTERNEGFEIGMNYSLIVERNKFERNILASKENMSMPLSSERFNSLVKAQNLDDMNKIISDILKIPSTSSCMGKICKTTKLTLILISICSNFLKHSKLDTLAYDIYHNVNTSEWINTNGKGHTLESKKKSEQYLTPRREVIRGVKLLGLRGPHCFFVCLDDIIMTDLVKLCNYFCNVKLLNVKTDSFSILLAQKYDVVVINIGNLNNSQINTLEEMLKNGVYKNKKTCFPISTTFWVYAVKPSIRNEKVTVGNYVRTTSQYGVLSFEDDDDVIEEVLRISDETERKGFGFYFELNNKFSYLRKSSLSHCEFSQMSDITKSIIKKYFDMAADLSTLTIYHIGICQLLCISVSILLGKKECLIEHVVLALLLYDKFVSPTKNKLTQFDKNLLISVINTPNDEDNSFQKLMNYFSSYLNATMNFWRKGQNQALNC